MQIGRRWRKIQRGLRISARRYSNGGGVRNALDSLVHVKPTETEEYADRAVTANAAYQRYRRFAGSRVPLKVTRLSEELRIGPDHKWGPQPFHYRDSDYRSIVQSVENLIVERG